MTRGESVLEAQRLRDEGLKVREVADRMGVAYRTVCAWLYDPDGSQLRERKASYRGRCDTCGGPTNGNGGPGTAGSCCKVCYRQALRDGAYWTRERIIEAIRSFADRYGRPPSAVDFNPTIARRRGQFDRIRRYYADGYPSTTQVRNVFGTWNQAIRASGFTPSTRGRKPASERI